MGVGVVRNADQCMWPRHMTSTWRGRESRQISFVGLDLPRGGHDGDSDDRGFETIAPRVEQIMAERIQKYARLRSSARV